MRSSHRVHSPSNKHAVGLPPRSVRSRIASAMEPTQHTKSVRRHRRIMSVLAFLVLGSAGAATAHAQPDAQPAGDQPGGDAATPEAPATPETPPPAPADPVPPTPPTPAAPPPPVMAPDMTEEEVAPVAEEDPRARRRGCTGRGRGEAKPGLDLRFVRDAL